MTGYTPVRRRNSRPPRDPSLGGEVLIPRPTPPHYRRVPRSLVPGLPGLRIWSSCAGHAVTTGGREVTNFAAVSLSRDDFEYLDVSGSAGPVLRVAVRALRVAGSPR